MLIQTVIVMRHARIVRLKTNNELTVEIERIKGDIKLIHKSIETIEKNHLRHIEDDINSIKKILYDENIRKQTLKYAIKKSKDFELQQIQKKLEKIFGNT